MGDEVDGYVTTGEYEERGTYSRSRIYDHWEGWEEAVKDVLGVEKPLGFSDDDEYLTAKGTTRTRTKVAHINDGGAPVCGNYISKEDLVGISDEEELQRKGLDVCERCERKL